MSKTTTVFDTLLTRLSELFPDHGRLTNPYKVEENSEQVLRKSYGLAAGPGNNSNRQLSCQLSYTRDYIIPITRVIRANEYAISKKDVATKSLLEDWFLLVAYLEENPTLGVGGGGFNAQYTSDNGVEFIFNEKDSFYKIETIVNVEIFEDLLL